MHGRWFGYTLVAIQFAALLYLAASGPWLARGWPLLLEIAGIGLGLWALAAMRASKLNITPAVHPGARLVSRGPYRWIRHPMYTSLLLGGLGLVWNAPSPLRWAAWAILAATLLVKLHYEERLLAAAFAAYPVYQAHTKRLIPYLY